MATELRVLGQVELRVDGRLVEVGHARQRCVLAVLLVEANRVVTMEQLLDRVWADRLPYKARPVASNYVSRLRRVLAGDVAVVRRGGGYLLEVDPEAVDLHRFRRLVQQARGQEDTRALALLEEAAGLWRGEPFAGLDTPWLAAVRTGLERERVAARLDHVDVALRCGRHAEVLPELFALADQEDSDERIAAQLMLALHRAGRTADALAHYRRLRDRLVEKLGTEPGAGLQDLHRQILAADPGLLPESAASPRRAEALPVPRQLPLTVRDFTGRAEQVAALDALLPAADGSAGGTVVISAVDGAAGIGKTTLAVWWAHRVQDRFPDGTLQVDLRGYGPDDPADPSEVLEDFLIAFGVGAGQIPKGAEARARLFRSLLAGQRVLIVLDNANSADQVRLLLPGTSGCMVVVTSRQSLTGLVVGEAAVQLTLDLLPEDEAIQLVTGILGATRAAAEPDAVLQLVRYCARLPLALRIAASQAAGPHTTVGDVVTELADDAYRLDVLSRGGDERATVRAVFDWSYRRLAPEHARVFRRLGLHPSPVFSVEAAAAVAGLELPEARRVIGILAEAHLIEPVAKRGRYRFHDLLRDYAADCAERDDTPDERAHARRLVLEWYAHHVKVVHHILFPTHDDFDPALRLTTRGRPEISITGREQAWTWSDLEWGNLVAATRDADRYDQNSLTLLLAIGTGMILFRRGRRDDLLRLFHWALGAARRNGDRVAEILALTYLGETYYEVARRQEARDAWQAARKPAGGPGDVRQQASAFYRAARELAHSIGESWLEGVALLGLGQISLERGDFAQARDHLLTALPLSAGLQHGRLEGVIECHLSMLHIKIGDYPRAFRHANRGLALHRKAHDSEGTAEVLHHMARSCHGMGKLQEAIALCEQVLKIDERQRRWQTTAETLDTLGTLLCDTGDTTRALQCWRDALPLFDQDGDPRANYLRDRLRKLENKSA